MNCDLNTKCDEHFEVSGLNIDVGTMVFTMLLLCSYDIFTRIKKYFIKTRCVRHKIK